MFSCKSLFLVLNLWVAMCFATRNLPSNCMEAGKTLFESGIYTIKVEPWVVEPFLVYCNHEALGGNWTVIQRRVDGSVDFYRDSGDYRVGFGNLANDFWIGLENLHALTTDRPQELLVALEDFDNQTRFAKYEYFAVGNERENYNLKLLGAYDGDAGDSLRHHHAQKFTTKDLDNDADPTANCAQYGTGAWWYHACYHSNLNGMYLNGSFTTHGPDSKRGIVWYTFRGHFYSLKRVQMMIRPRMN